MSDAKQNWYEKKESTNSFGIKIVIWAFKLGGWPLANTILFFITSFVWLFNSRVKKYSNEYAENLRAYATREGKKLPKFSSFWHIFRFCQSVLEKLLAWQGLLTVKAVTSVDNAHERMLEVAAQSEGAVIIGGHLGNIEMLRAMNSGFTDKSINILILTANSSKFLKVMENINPASNLNFIAADDITPGTIIDLSEKVKRGEWVVVLADRLVNENSRSVEVEFLTKKVSLPQGPWILAHLLQVPVYTLFNVKSNGEQRVYFKEWGCVSLSRKNKEADISKYATKYVEEMSEILLEAPCDWFNIYSYWKEK